MPLKLRILALLFFATLSGNQLNAKEKIQAYFMNDSINGLKFSDAYETHNMGLVYSRNHYYLKLDLGIVSPDMHVYRNQYREANRSFGEIISLEIGQTKNTKNHYKFYARMKATDDFGLDNLQDFAHRLLSLQQVKGVNDLIRMPANVWVGVGLRSEFEPNISALKNTKFNFDGFFGSDTTFLRTSFRKEFFYSRFDYDLSIGGLFTAYDNVISAPPIKAEERMLIPELSVGISYNYEPYSIFVRDTFSLPTIKSDSTVYGFL